MAYTFNGGIHVDERKNTRGMAAEPFTEPKRVAIPMSQHIGAPCLPLVAVGDQVTVGQCIGDNPNALCCPVHASVSGKVVAMEERRVISGAAVLHAVIENDFQYTLCPDLKGVDKPLEELTAEEIIERVRSAGVVGMGGAAFPTYAKIKSALGKAKHLIINCAECEPYITANHRLMLEQPEAVLKGIKILIHALGVRKAVIAIEDNKEDVIELFENKIDDKALFDIRVMKTKYPQGDERQIIFALYGKEIPTGGLPADVGCVLFNPETAVSIYRALSSGMPVVKKRITVDGDCIKQPRNLIVPVGTSFGDVAEFCGGVRKRFARLISGGPMMGQAQWSLDGVVTKGTGALLFLGEEKEEAGQCIRCGKCVRACQMHLMPALLAAYSEKKDYGECERLGAMSCVECGCCTYVCPGKVQIVQYIRNAKGAINEARRRLKEKGEGK
ncbi:MAG: electron transport complex subunit RsxC [Clostridia bacterium]|nr:electron transport complex subunit RsxC [Clostridia bacterium]